MNEKWCRWKPLDQCEKDENTNQDQRVKPLTFDFIWMYADEWFLNRWKYMTKYNCHGDADEKKLKRKCNAILR